MSNCDVCSKQLEQGAGYLLTTKQIASSEKYWHHTFSAAGLRFDSGYIDPQQNVSVVHQKADVIFQTIASSTPWMTCDSCVGMFDVNRDEARQYATRWYATKGKFSPPGSGAVSFSDANIPFADPVETFMIKTDLGQGNRKLVSKSSCFIASACYGSPDCSQVLDLRAFRDEVLLNSRIGKKIVSAYYRVSPSVALWLADHPAWRSLVRRCLIEPAVGLVRAFKRT